MTASRVKILIVEDDDTYAGLLGVVFSDYAEVERASSLREALEKANGHDAVFLDLGLPDSCGLDTFSKMYSQFPTKPIVIVTGDDDPSTAFRAMKLGARDFVMKSRANLVSLEATIKDVLREVHSERLYVSAMDSFDIGLKKLAAS